MLLVLSVLLVLSGICGVTSNQQRYQALANTGLHVITSVFSFCMHVTKFNFYLFSLHLRCDF